MTQSHPFRIAFVVLLGSTALAYALLSLGMLASAHAAGIADPVVAASPAGDLTSVLAIAISLAAALLSAASIVLHVVAPRTKTLVDDHWRDKVDEVLAFARRVQPPVDAVAPARKPSSVPGSGVLLALLVAGLATQPACATVKAAPKAAGHAVIDCAKADAPAIFVLLAQLGVQSGLDLLNLGVIDWSGFEAKALQHGAVIGGCAASTFVAALSASRPTVQGLLPAPDPGRDALERLRAHWGGVEWQ